MLDVYNLLNGAAILAVNSNYGPAERQPTGVLGPVLIRGAQNY
jgi:hypothetical protein